jgi:ankyrin repeat protein
LEQAALQGRGAFITELLARNPAVLRRRPPPQSSAIVFALDCSHSEVVPLLARVWHVPDDLPHAAGLGDLDRVKGWFDESGRPAFGQVSEHFPANTPQKMENLHWGTAGKEQQVLDTALAWACLNHRFEVAEFLLEHGSDINTRWGTHEPASILHEVAMRHDLEAARFLIDHGIDLTIRDFRWNATAAGWAYVAAKDQEMADLLVDAERERENGPPVSGAVPSDS